MSDKTANATMVTLARESRGMTQTELARAAKVSQALLSKIEAGVKPVSGPILERLVQALGYPEKFFFQTDTIFGPGIGEFFHRRRMDISNKVITRLHAIINIMIIHVGRLLRSVNLPPLKICPIDKDDFESPQEVAEALRTIWQIPSGPIPDVMRTIENAGGIVIRFPFGTPQIDAISRWIPGLPPLFFVNEGLTTDRERMSLCHELGHIIMHKVPNPQMEGEANEFAGAFLLPEQDISSQLHRINLDRLAVLKPVWKVSMAALLFRATELRKVSQPVAKILWAQMAQRGFKRREPVELDLPPEEPTVLRDIFELHCTHYGYNLEEFSNALAVEQEDLLSMYKIPQIQPINRRPLHLIR